LTSQQFDADTAVNRVLKAAAEVAVRVQSGSARTRKRAQASGSDV